MAEDGVDPPDTGSPHRDHPNRSVTRPLTATAKAAIDAAVKRSLDDALKGLGVPVPSPKEQALVERVTREVTNAYEETVTASYQGPMPPPTMLQGFEDVVPGLARQIADMALTERNHRHSWENKALWNDILAQSEGIFLGWILASACATGAFYLALQGNNIGAGVLLSVVVVSLVRTFTSYGASKRSVSALEQRDNQQHPAIQSQQEKKIKGRRR